MLRVQLPERFPVLLHLMVIIEAVQRLVLVNRGAVRVELLALQARVSVLTGAHCLLALVGAG